MIPRLEDIPENPGIYLMKKNSVIIYVGKAKNLRNRVSSYFNREHESMKTTELVKNIEDIEFIICKTEIDALILENNYIKKYSPKYNIALKDNKTYPYLKISREKFPYIKSIRTTKELENKKAIYFGPYPNSIYNLKKILLRLFKIRDCNRDMSKTYDKPCLKYYMHFCSGPCCYKNIENEYFERINAVIKILKGQGKEYVEELEKKMKIASNEMRFEEAIVYRNQIKELKNSIVNQITEFKKIVDEDYFVYKIVNETLFLTILSCREGKIQDKNSIQVSIKDKIYENIDEEVFIHYYSKHTPAKNIILEEKYDGKEKNIKEWLEKSLDHKVNFFFPKIKSRKKEILDMALLNLEKDIEAYYKKKTVLEAGLMKIYKILKLKNYPRRIECFDISNIQGKDAVASMSVLIEGVSKPKEYRKFKINCKDTPDDFEMMREVITRRYSKLKKEEFPDMILIDGGLGQINAVGQILKNLDCLEISDLVSIAKREEEIYKFGISEPFIFSKDEEAIKIFQRVRDEAHRFGITYHRKLRSKRVLSSQLDEIKGVGEKRKTKLFQDFKTLENIVSADLSKLHEYVPLSVAIEIKKIILKK